MRTFIKNFEKVVLAKSPVKDIMSVFSAMQKEIMRGVNKRVIHKNAAARKISRMYSKVRSVVEGTSSVKSR
jgi:small subunit ribosomal protein S20